MRSRTVAGALVCAMSLAGAACGASKSATNASSPIVSATSSPDPSASASATPPTVPSTPTTIAQAHGADDFCNVKGPGNPALAFATSAQGGAGADQLRHDINTSLEAAPPEIRPDVQTLADIELPILDGKVGQAQIETELDDPRVVVATQHISSWAAAHCMK